MPVPWIGHAIELSALALFLWAFAEMHKRGSGFAQELLVAAAYGWILEVFDMMIFGSYHYGPLTWAWLGHVPIYIPLLWATIIHSSMELSDRSGIPEWARPALDGLLAVLIDLAIDAIAIRLGLWSWRIPLNEGWFGVPAGNLCAWMWVAVWYSGVTRFVRGRIEKRGEPSWHRWLVPVVAYPGLLASLIAIGFLGDSIGLRTPNQRLWLFAMHGVVFSLLVAYAARQRRAAVSSPLSPSLLWSRWVMHGSFLLLWACVPEIRTVKGLGLLAASAVLLEALVVRWCDEASAEGRPLVVYDGECGLCAGCLKWLYRLDWLHVFDARPYQDRTLYRQFPQLSYAACEKAMYVVLPDGRFFAGPEAFKEIFLRMPLMAGVGLLMSVPGVTYLLQPAYRWIADNRYRISGRCRLPVLQKP